MSTAIGPILGGVLTDTIGWRYIFWLNVPVGVLALLMTAFTCPNRGTPMRRASTSAARHWRCWASAR